MGVLMGMMSKCVAEIEVVPSEPHESGRPYRLLPGDFGSDTSESFRAGGQRAARCGERVQQSVSPCDAAARGRQEQADAASAPRKAQTPSRPRERQAWATPVVEG